MKSFVIVSVRTQSGGVKDLFPIFSGSKRGETVKAGAKNKIHHSSRKGIDKKAR